MCLIIKIKISNEFNIRLDSNTRKGKWESRKLIKRTFKDVKHKNEKIKSKSKS